MNNFCFICSILPYVNVYCIENKNNKANEDTFVTFITNFAALFKLITLLIQSYYYTHKVLAITMPTLFFRDMGLLFLFIQA